MNIVERTRAALDAAAAIALRFSPASLTLEHKNGWDIAAGAALIRAGGEIAYAPDGHNPTFNNRNPLQQGLIAHSPDLFAAVQQTLAAG
jgi:3'-phosphoadenosine 5'-phosphosulfate (PAPS) 3'-phosphatase